jgi:hypothetical protein
VTELLRGFSLVVAVLGWALWFKSDSPIIGAACLGGAYAVLWMSICFVPEVEDA